MPATIPMDVYEEFERGLGKEGARKVVKGLEAVISDFTEYKWKVTKDELLGAIRKEFITRELFEERMSLFDGKINTLKVGMEGKIDALKVELEGKIDALKVELGGKIDALKVELGGKIDTLKVELEGKIERSKMELEGKIMQLDGKFEKLNQKFNFMIILMVLALTLMNPVMAEIIKGFLK